MKGQIQYLFRDKKIFSWALYDWANSAFATTVMAGFFPVLYREYFHAGESAEVISFHYGLTNSLASFFVAFCAPFLGALADKRRGAKSYLVGFTLLGVLSTVLIAFLGKGDWLAASGTFALSLVGFSGAIVFYDALLPSVSNRGNIDWVSSFGYSLGYLGGGILFALNVWFVGAKETFGIEDQSFAMQLCFVSVGVWWLAFSLPLFRTLPEKEGTPSPLFETLKDSVRETISTLSEIRKFRHVFLFLVAYWFYMDGVNSVMRLAVSYGVSIGFDSTDLIKALLVTQFVGFPAALVFGALGSRFGSRPLIVVGIAGYLIATVLASLMSSVTHFYLLAIFVGLFQGGVQALSRSYYGSLIPQEKSAEFFGFYNLVGKCTAILGPTAVGILGVWLHSDRLGILALAGLFAAGGGFLLFVREERADTDRIPGS
ncbi:MAG: MFS transporter [Bdellovibrionales bacterium]|nr:MFS transporter [Bdellovibrionales bacterium]